MAESFLKSIKINKPTEEAHRLFLRFGSGEFQREKLTVKKGPTTDVVSGYDYLGLMQDIFLELYSNESVDYSGVIIAVDTKKTPSLIEELELKVVKKVGKKTTIAGSMKGSELKAAKHALFELRAGFLVSLTHGKSTLKSKTAFPKPGKTVEGFVKMKIDGKAFGTICEALLLPEFKKRAVIETKYNIEKVVFNEALLKKDPVQARMESRRDATIVRSMTIDGILTTEEIKALV